MVVLLKKILLVSFTSPVLNDFEVEGSIHFYLNCVLLEFFSLSSRLAVLLVHQRYVYGWLLFAGGCEHMPWWSVKCRLYKSRNTLQRTWWHHAQFLQQRYFSKSHVILWWYSLSLLKQPQNLKSYNMIGWLHGQTMHFFPCADRVGRSGICGKPK